MRAVIGDAAGPSDVPSHLETMLTSFAIAHLRSITMGPEIAEYLARIDATLEPYAGRFVVHGSEVDILEGPWAGDLVVIEFPDRDLARSWYDSSAYQQIVRLRTHNSDGSVILVDGVTELHRATEILGDPQRRQPVRGLVHG